MKKNYLKSIFTIIGLTVLGLNLSATILFYEDFTYETPNETLSEITSWTKVGSGTVEPFIGNTSPLIHSNYNGGGGNYLSFPRGSSTSNRFAKSFPQVVNLEAGDVYYISFLLNIASTTQTADANNDSFFLGVSNGVPGVGVRFFNRIIVKQHGEGYAIGVAKTGNSVAFADEPTELLFNETYLVVLRHTVVSGTSNDIVELWINPELSREPLSADVEVVTTEGVDPSQIADFVWQNNSTRGPAGKIDGIRIAIGGNSALAWANLDAFDDITINVEKPSLDERGNVISTTYFDLSGRAVTNPTKGQIYIKKTTYEDGTTITEKFFMN